MSRTVALTYGIFSGERRGGRFRKALRRAGYTVVKDMVTADIIIGHSAGCFWLPAAPTHQKLLLIDPPYWPGRTTRERARARLKNNLHWRAYGYPLRYWLRHNAWGIYYAVRDFRRTLRIVRHAPVYDLAKIIAGHQAILVRNKDDDWLGPDLAALQQANPDLIVKQLPGDHDDCMYRPEPYVELLRLFTDELVT